jgi:membrane-bound inhibitor of C-type lysozyme
MRPRSSIKSSSLIAVALAFASGCSRDDGPAVLIPEPATAGPSTNPAPQPPDPPSELAPAESRRLRVSPFGNAGPGSDADDIGDVTTPLLTRLVFQCSDDVTFAVRIIGDRLEVFPPGIANNYIVMSRVPSESGARYTAPNAEFRGNSDLATLQVDTERYVDCVSNPAARAWGTAGPGAAR